MQIELNDENFFSLPICEILWKIFEETYIFPFINKIMLDRYNIDYFTKRSELITTNKNIYSKQELLVMWQEICNNSETVLNLILIHKISIYLEFLTTFIIDTIRKDSVKKYFNLKENMYQNIESLYKKELYIELICVDKNTMQELNREYMCKDYPTDVLSFPLIIQDMPIKQCLGSIIINLHEVCDKADEYNHDIYAEFSLLFIHAFLHIIGFNHEVDNGEQRLVEQEIIKALHLPNSLILRTEHKN